MRPGRREGDKRGEAKKGEGASKKRRRKAHVSRAATVRASQEKKRKRERWMRSSGKSNKKAVNDGG